MITITEEIDPTIKISTLPAICTVSFFFMFTIQIFTVMNLPATGAALAATPVRLGFF